MYFIIMYAAKLAGFLFSAFAIVSNFFFILSSILIAITGFDDGIFPRFLVLTKCYSLFILCL